MEMMICDIVNKTEPAQYTIPELWASLISICLGLAAIWAVIKIAVEIKRWFDRPEDMQNKRITKLEDDVESLKDSVDQLHLEYLDSVKMLKEHHISEMEKLTREHEDILAHYRRTRDRHDAEIGMLSDGMMIMVKSVNAMLSKIINQDLTADDMLQDCYHETTDYIFKRPMPNKKGGLDE